MASQKDDAHFFQSISAIDYQFVHEEVLGSDAQIHERQEMLHKAIVLGNSYNRKARLTCLTENGYEYLKGKIRAISNNRIILEGGYTIPIKAIESVEIF